MTFNPNEQRDKDGKWTAGDGGRRLTLDELDPATSDQAHAENIRRYKLAADQVAKDLGFNPDRIEVSGETKTFELNGKTRLYAGAAFLDTGKIVIYEPHIAPSSISNVVAHEIGHQKFQKFINDYQADYKRMQEDTKDVRNKDIDLVMRYDGMLKEPYAEKYPVYQKYTEVMMPSVIDNFAKSDGITSYSEEWWKAWHEQKANTSQAMHETIAEMTARDYVKGPDYETEADKFKAAGYALDVSYGRAGSADRNAYSVRKWKQKDKLDEGALPPSLQRELARLRQAAVRGSSSAASGYSKKPAPEWVALYDAINEHWDKTK